jgi:hypothetical protein
MMAAVDLMADLTLLAAASTLFAETEKPSHLTS